MTESRSIELRVVEAEVVLEHGPGQLEPTISDPRTRILLGLLDLLGPEDRQLLESTTDGASVAEVSRLQGSTRSALSYRLIVLTDWLAYCAPITLRIEPILAGFEFGLGLRAQSWWYWHTGGRAASVGRLERARPELVVDHARWVVPARSASRPG